MTSVSGRRVQSAERLPAAFAALPPKQRTLFRAARTLLRNRFPTANELAYDYGFAVLVAYAPAEQGKDAILSLRASDKGVSLYFSQGPKLPDPKRLLRGSATQVRYIELESARQLSDPDVEALIAATLAQARIPFPATGKGTLIIKTDGTQNSKAGTAKNSRAATPKRSKPPAKKK